MVMKVRSDVIDQIRRVADEQEKSLAPLDDDLLLLESGLDSLCFAIIIARLEDTLGIDPFGAANAGDSRFPLTLGELVSFYENASRANYG
jgi:acyl carrier protein